MADHFEAAGDVLEDFGDVLAHFAHGAAASRAGAGRFVDNIAARQRFGQLAPLLLRRRLFLRGLGGLRCRRRSGAASAWASAASISSSLSSSCSSSRLTRSDEAPKDMRFRRAIWVFSFSASSVFNRRPALAASRSAVRSATSRLSSSISLGRPAASAMKQNYLLRGFAPSSRKLRCKSFARRPPLKAFKQHRELRRRQRHGPLLGHRPGKPASSPAAWRTGRSPGHPNRGF